jgi:hypothetical protein
MIDELKGFVTDERMARWTLSEAAGSDGPPPVFLVGFPRSGTTLLDRVLDAHSQVHVLEEKDTLGPLLSRYAGQTGALAALDDVDDPARREGMAVYRDRLRAEGAPPGYVVVDKLPLNSIHLALIHRLMPDALVIFALRDPRDVCLSCFFQSFGLNEAMSQFLDWQQTAIYYDAVQTVAHRALDGMPIRRAVVRYEDLTVDLESAVKPALDLIGLDWEPGMSRFAELARKAVIDTPSYDQVVRPLYRQSVGRWRSYPEAIAEVEPRLRPWLQRFGYEPAGPRAAL